MHLMVIGYPERLVADHRVLLATAERAGFSAELVAPSRLALMIDTGGERVLVDGRARRPDVVLPRGVNRPWPLVRQVLEVWERQGVVTVPTVAAADRCADKVTTTRILAAAGVPVLPTLAVVPGADVTLAPLAGVGTLVAKPARGSKARGVEAFPTLDHAQASLQLGRALVGGMVDHHVVQPLASDAGCDYRVVVAKGQVIAVTERRAPDHEFVTNRAGATVVDIDHPERRLPEVVHVAVTATTALGLDFGGVDVIRHCGQAVVLEVNAWPGLASQARDDQLAKSLVHLVADLLNAN